ncbi:MAG: hypothetical protein KDA77_20045, partial [Planctomycetaceae bacterium]|nr:hypothetical protein [Planctomycetaceae bacterium]
DTSVLPNASLNANDIVPTAVKTDLLISESTNGDRIQSETFEQRRKLLIRTVQEAVDRGGSVLIPAFALGRSGEAAIILDQAIQNGELKLPEDSGIYLDGMAREIARKLRRDPDMRTYAGLMGPGSGVKPVEDENQRKTILNKIKNGKPQILIAGSGMLSGGLAVRYFELLASDPKHQLITVGYQAPGTLGSKVLSGLQNAAAHPDGSRDAFEVQWEDEIYRKRKGEKVQKTVTVRMGVRSVSLSGHAMQDELVELIFDLDAYLTLLVHGDISAKEALMNHEMLQHLTFINRQNSGLQNGDEILSRLPDRSKEFDEIQADALPEPNQPLPDRLENQLNSAVDDWINEFINTGVLDWSSQEEMERIEDLLLFYFQSSKNLSKLNSDLLDLYVDQIGDPGQLIVWLDTFRRDELDKRSRTRQEKVRDPILQQTAPQKIKKKDQTADLEEKLIVEWTRKVRDYFSQHPSDIFGEEENTNLELAATLFFQSGITV